MRNGMVILHEKDIYLPAALYLDNKNKHKKKFIWLREHKGKIKDECLIG